METSALLGQQSPWEYETYFDPALSVQVGSIEGRVAVQHIEDNMQTKNFTFKCHRDAESTYSVNDIRFHPVHHTFVTAGADGAYNFWDKDSKQRLKVRETQTPRLNPGPEGQSHAIVESLLRGGFVGLGTIFGKNSKQY